MRFVLPYHEAMRFEAATPASRLLARLMPWMKGRRPAWMIRLGLFLYDTLGRRDPLFPTTRSLDLKADAAGQPLQAKYRRAFEYSDCQVDDSRLVVLNAVDAAARGARILTRQKVVKAKAQDGIWQVSLQDSDTGQIQQIKARSLVNAAGPWVGSVLADIDVPPPDHAVRLVRGSHIVTHRLYDHDKAYFLQGKDGRIVFICPYHQDFSLIGTTDIDHPDPDTPAECSPAETAYLLDFVSDYLKFPVTPEDVIWSFAGVRPLFDEGGGAASAASRDYRLDLETAAGAPLLNVFGGKITAYRHLSEQALDKLAKVFPTASPAWTKTAPLPGGDFRPEDLALKITEFHTRFAFLPATTAARLVRAYGTGADKIMGDARALADLGQEFGAGLTAHEVRWLMSQEFARTTDDILWRRSKLGLRFAPDQVSALAAFMAQDAMLETPAPTGQNSGINQF
jgi:glycerol-3-phosphate dehydrogenase